MQEEIIEEDTERERAEYAGLQRKIEKKRVRSINKVRDRGRRREWERKMHREYRNRDQVKTVAAR